jgi:hypothetical protein
MVAKRVDQTGPPDDVRPLGYRTPRLSADGTDTAALGVVSEEHVREGAAIAPLSMSKPVLVNGIDHAARPDLKER